MNILHSKQQQKIKRIIKEVQREMMEIIMKLGRGFTFALQLPPEANAHYAGKGVSMGAADTPIFWYRPKDAMTYRVIYADLSVREAEAPPDVPDAQPIGAQGDVTFGVLDRAKRRVGGDRQALNV